ncbi:hypothetical protein MOMMJLID_CDS0019 [Arthrobacter phage 1191A]|nr:hypothetical protein MOMMJLID_CDS0019 [Arthrobacter phage 1191A]
MLHHTKGVYSMMDNPFVNDVPPLKPPPITRWIDATVTSESPLKVQLDGYDEGPQEPTKPPLVGGLVVNERVLCLMQGRQLVILGRYGG